MKNIKLQPGMKSYAKIIDTAIINVTPEFASRLTSKYGTNVPYTCEEKGLFLLYDKGIYTAIDNTTGDCICEDFECKSSALIWLFGLQEVAPLQSAEDTKFWY